ncbi:MAG TPA: ArdC family protein [Caproicibacter sp.]|nr:ArdC family protein [Caproicibacter sp.]
MDKDEKVKELSQKLIDGVRLTFESNRFKQYLNFMSVFHHYSPRNIALIFLQKPTAIQVASFEEWKKLGRYVRRGETGISIFEPTKIVEKIKKPVLSDTGNPVSDKNGNPQEEEINKIRIRFHQVTVFDVSQTDGDPLPALCNELQSAVPDFKTIFSALQHLSPYKIVFEKMPDDKKGYCSHAEKKIALRPGMSDQQIVKTLIHEYAHATLHANSPKSEREKEIEAESVAFIVSDFLGFDTSGYSFDYVSAWGCGMGFTQLMSVLENIQNDAVNIISHIDAEMRSLDQTQAAEYQKLPERLNEAAIKSEKLSIEKEMIPSGKLLA